MASRREFLKKTSYVAPAILTLGASPSFGGAGSVREPRKKTTPKAKPKPKPKKKKKR
jgi:hypothetical protein